MTKALQKDNTVCELELGKQFEIAIFEM